MVPVAPKESIVGWVGPSGPLSWHSSRRRAVVKHLPALLLVFSLACGGDAPPPAGRRDAGPTAQIDGALPFDDAGSDAGGRGTDPVLPPADVLADAVIYEIRWTPPAE